MGSHLFVYLLVKLRTWRNIRQNRACKCVIYFIKINAEIINKRLSILIDEYGKETCKVDGAALNASLLRYFVEKERCPLVLSMMRIILMLNL